MADGVIVDGKSYPLIHPITKRPISIFGPEDTGMEFVVGTGYNKRRRAPLRHGVIHWTGSENAIETMYRVLNNRKLGVEFAIDPMGSLYQFCDPKKVDTADAGAANKTSWGVEVVCAGLVRKRKPGKKFRAWKAPGHMGARPKYKTRIHGRKMECRAFYPAQMQTLCALNALMVDAVPEYEDGVCVDSGVINFKRFRGAIGHLNLKRGKTDPGTKPMELLKLFMDNRHESGEVIDALWPEGF